jgi:hypothetical protein
VTFQNADKRAQLRLRARSRPQLLPGTVRQPQLHLRRLEDHAEPRAADGADLARARAGRPVAQRVQRLGRIRSRRLQRPRAGQLATATASRTSGRTARPTSSSRGGRRSTWWSRSGWASSTCASASTTWPTAGSTTRRASAATRSASGLRAGPHLQPVARLQRLLVAFMRSTRGTMFQISRTLTGVAVATLLMVGLQSTSVIGQLAPPVTVPGIDKQVVVVTGEITGTMNWTANFVYVLRGAVFIKEGGTLNIQAGTLIAGEAGSVGTLIVERGGRSTPSARARRRSSSPATSRWGSGPAATGAASSSTAAPRSTSRAGSSARPTPASTAATTRTTTAAPALRARRVRRGRVQPRQRAERHRLPGRRPRRHLRVHPGAHEPRRRVRVVRRHGGHQVRVPRTPATTASTGRSAGPAARSSSVHQRGDDADWGIEADNNEFNNNLLPRANPQIYN